MPRKSTKKATSKNPAGTEPKIVEEAGKTTVEVLRDLAGEFEKNALACSARQQDPDTNVHERARCTVRANVWKKAQTRLKTLADDLEG